MGLGIGIFRSSPGDSNVQPGSGSIILTDCALIPPFLGEITTPGLQVAGWIQGGAWTSQHTWVPRGPSPFLPSPHFPLPFLTSHFPTSWKAKFLLVPSVRILGTDTEKGLGIRIHYIHPELSCWLSLCFCNIIVSASLFLFYFFKASFHLFIFFNC